MIALMSQTKLPDSSNPLSDIVGAVQFRVSVFIKANSVWKTAETVNGTIGRDCVLLWEGDLIPEDSIVSLD